MAGGNGGGIGLGEQLVYSIDVRNEGAEPAEAVTLSDALPPGVEPVGVQTSQGSCELGSTVTCAFGTLDSFGGYASVHISTRTKVEGSWQNTAFVDSATEDPNRANNSATVVVDIVAPVPPPVAQLAVTDPVFRVTRSRRATRFAFVMARPGAARFQIQRRVDGVWIDVGRPFERLAAQGPNIVAFSGRVRRGARLRALRPGRYRARVSALDPGGRASAARTVRFRVVG
jgi:uncharacterized repeat protein (TIGR01451 family)